MDLISLIVFCAVIIAAFVCKVNTGYMAIFAALVLAHIAGVSEKRLISSFGSSLFLMLLGVMYLFCIAQENKTLDVLAKKVIALCKGRIKLFPPILFLIGAVLSAIGPGLISVTALMAAIVVALAKQTGCDPIRLLPFGALGAFGGGLSPITPSGIVAVTTAAANGIEGLELPMNIAMALNCTLFAAILYFFVFKWHKYQPAPSAQTEGEKAPSFTLMQWITLAGIILVALLTALFKVNVGLAAISVSVILTILHAADESVVMKKVPWNTLVMIAGVGILISLVTELGGIDLLSRVLSSLVGEKTVAAIMTVLAGCMSWFSSASGVVMPTLIPTVPDIAASLSGADVISITVGVCVGANMAALSPLSSCGALMLSAYASSDDVTAKDRNRVFGQLFAMSAGGVLFGALLALLGVF